MSLGASVSLSPSVATALLASRRHIATPPIRQLTRVGRTFDDDEACGFFEEGGHNTREDFGNDFGDGVGAASEGGGADTVGQGNDGAAPPAEDDDEKVVEITEEEAAKLDKLFQRKVLKHQFLSKEERARLVKMIFTEFYNELGNEKDDPAMHYQASLEITWLEEWVEALMLGDEKPSPGSSVTVPRNIDEARRLIKRSVLERVDLHKPLSYIIGSQPFFGCNMLCQTPLLCPRPETEMWTHWFVKECLAKATTVEAPLKILDVCAGTGCVGVAIAKHVPRAHVTALDLLPEAIEVSRRNARANGVAEARYQAVQSDMFEYFTDKSPEETSAVRPQANAYPGSSPAVLRDDHSATVPDHEGVKVTGEKNSDAVEKFQSVVNPPTRPKLKIAEKHIATFDAIVSNPPYILPDQYVNLPRNITHWESKMALVGDDYRESRQYLYFQELCEYGLKLLKHRKDRDPALRHLPNICIEIGLQGRMVASLMERSGLFEDVEVHLDYAQQERWITANSKH